LKKSKNPIKTTAARNLLRSTIMNYGSFTEWSAEKIPSVTSECCTADEHNKGTTTLKQIFREA